MSLVCFLSCFKVCLQNSPLGRIWSYCNHKILFNTVSQQIINGIIVCSKEEWNSFEEYSCPEILLVSVLLLHKVQIITFPLIFVFFPVSISHKRIGYLYKWSQCMFLPLIFNNCGRHSIAFKQSRESIKIWFLNWLCSLKAEILQWSLVFRIVLHFHNTFTVCLWIWWFFKLFPVSDTRRKMLLASENKLEVAICSFM